MLVELTMGFVPGSKRMLSLSLPARIALLVAIFLVVCVATAFVAFYQTENRASWNYWVNPVRVTVIAVLLVVIPVVVYQVLRLWLTGVRSRFPDIDEAWRAGLAELQRCGIDLSETPIFLLLGSADEAQEKAVFGAARLDLRIRDLPQGPAALHWFATGEAVYLAPDEHVLPQQPGRSEPFGAERGATADRAVAARARRRRDSRYRGGGGSRNPSVASSSPMPAPASSGAAPQSDIRGTMMLGAAVGDRLPQTAEKRLVTLPPADAVEQQARLGYVCELLRRLRRPLCPANGVLALLPYDLILHGPREAIELERCVKRDMDALREGLMLRCPVTALVVGMEQDAGFRELLRRVGRERSIGQRFGKGFSLWNLPVHERLTAVCLHACGAFEDWIYALFAERGSLSKPGNTKLFALLCNMRRNVQSRLAKIVANGFGFDPEVEPDHEPLLFGGLYFAATGETEDRQAFVKSVFEKLPEQQEEIEWMEAARLEDGKYRTLALWAYGLDTLLLSRPYRHVRLQVALGETVAGKKSDFLFFGSVLGLGNASHRRRMKGNAGRPRAAFDLEASARGGCYGQRWLIGAFPCLPLRGPLSRNNGSSSARGSSVRWRYRFTASCRHGSSWTT